MDEKLNSAQAKQNELLEIIEGSSEIKSQRPVYHFATPGGWCNDPNGFSQFENKVHLFYQYHPYSTKWGPMHWGHVTSSDMLHWELQPIALAPETDGDSKGCFSGTAMDDGGKHLIAYTGVSNNGKSDIQNQCVAIGDGTVYKRISLSPVITAADIPFDYSTENFTFRKGGTCPVLKNEVALSYNFAKEYGFSVGSIIKLCYSVKPSDDYLIHDWVTEEFTVTGLTDMFGHTVIMGNDFENASADFVRVVSGKIEGNSRQKALYLKKIQEISGENTIISGREAVSNEAGYMYPVTGLLKFVLSAVSLLTIALVTVMYYKVIIHEDKRSVLLMRCIGTGKTKIKKWQLLRTLILILISFAAAVIFTKTAGNAVMSYGFGQAGCSGVRFIENPLHVWCAVPASVLATVCISLAVCMRDINKTELRDVCSE